MSIDDIVFVYHLEDEGLMSWHGRLHSHPQGKYEFTYFISGEGSFRTGPVIYTVHPGDLFLTRPEELHQLIPARKRRPITHYATLIDTEDDDDMAALLDSWLINPHHIGTQHRFFFADLLMKHFSAKERLVTAAQHMFTAFVYSLEDGLPSGSSSADNVHIEKALAFMLGSIESDCDLDGICSRLGISHEHFVRLFTKRMGTPPMKYYTRLKIEAARAMLASTNLKMSEISDKLRFVDQFAFSRTFKREAGLSPLQFRAHCLQKDDFRNRRFR